MNALPVIVESPAKSLRTMFRSAPHLIIRNDRRRVLTGRKRLAELKRREVAEADFDKAVNLKPDRPDVRAARGLVQNPGGVLHSSD
jgi:hypothetical protein